LFDGCRKAKPRQNRRAQRQSAHWRRNGETSPTGSNGRAALRSNERFLMKTIGVERLKRSA
jgi:hypothetical protein